MSKRSAKTGHRSTAGKQQGSASHRVNVRLDAAAREKLAILEMQTGQSTSNVLRDAVSHLFASRAVDAKSAPSALDRLVGKFSKSPKDLSTSYKRYLTDSLAKKHSGS
jgi:hypothetical protein